jgi:putative Mn2+ efflux pump MntP
VSFASILLLAVGLALDAMAAAAAKGCSLPRVRPRHVASVSLFFGGFQALMPLAGWLLGAKMGPLIEAWDHWIAFGMLLALGLHMLWEAHEARDEADQSGAAPDFGWKVMLGLAIATSIDALAAGITLPILGAPLVLSIATIGIVTALLSALGLFAGRRFGAAIGGKLDVVGAVVLIALGCKILAEHTLGGA